MSNYSREDSRALGFVFAWLMIAGADENIKDVEFEFIMHFADGCEYTKEYDKKELIKASRDFLAEVISREGCINAGFNQIGEFLKGDTEVYYEFLLRLFTLMLVDADLDIKECAYASKIISAIEIPMELVITASLNVAKDMEYSFTT
jgi:hypothetical protein